MRQLRWVWICAFFVCLACEQELPVKTQPLASRVELAAGGVWSVVDGQKWGLISGDMLPGQSRVTVDKGGRAVLRLSDGTGVVLRSGTTVTVDNDIVTLEFGELWVDAPAVEKMLSRVRCGELNITASGAGFDVGRVGDKTTVYVARGIVVVDFEGKMLEIAEGEKSTFENNVSPTIQAVSFWEDWTGGMADKEIIRRLGAEASGRIYGIDKAHPGRIPKELQIKSQSVEVKIVDGIATTTVDQRFFNPSAASLEGWYWFTVPDGASVEDFLLEVNGELIGGEMVERKQARSTYEAAVKRQMDPALLEWIDGQSFRARIYPILPAGDRRVVITYRELLPLADGVYRYVFPMGSKSDVAIDAFSLTVDLGKDGNDFEISTGADARIEKGGRQVTMRRSGYVPKSDFLLELRPKISMPPLRIERYQSDDKEADYVMLRYAPDKRWHSGLEPVGEVAIVVDTSAGGSEAERLMKSDVVESVLRALSSSDKFVLIAGDLNSSKVFPKKGMALATDQNVSSAMVQLSQILSAGATDLGKMLGSGIKAVHGAEQPAVLYVGDGRATVGETMPGELAERLRRSMGDSRTRLFTMAVGDDANYPLLERLARVGGGRALRVNGSQQTAQQGLQFVGHLKTPTVTELKIDAGAGLDQVFSSAAGKISRGNEVVLMARTHHPLPKKIGITGRLDGKQFSEVHDVDVRKGRKYEHIRTLWARMYLERMMGQGVESAKGSIIALGLKYFLMTPFTSFLVLESEQAFEAAGIKRNRHLKKKQKTETEKNIRDKKEDKYPKYMLTPADEQSQEEAPQGQMARDRNVLGKAGARRSSQEASRQSMRDKKYGIKGPVDNPDPHMARSKAREMASSAGILSYLSSENAATLPFGSDAALGMDPENALGALTGNQFGDNYGYGGLGLRGTGRGSGGYEQNTWGGIRGKGSGNGYGNMNTFGQMGRRGPAKRSYTPKVKLGPINKKGKLSTTVIKRIIHRHLNELKFCYERELSGNPHLAGQLGIKFIVSGTGSVQMAAVASSTLGNTSVEQCVVKSFRRWTFPQPEAGGIVIANQMLMFASKKNKSFLGGNRPVNLPLRATKGIFKGGLCSDASARPLYQKRILWDRRLAATSDPAMHLQLFLEAGNRCELRRWVDRKSLLNMVAGRADTPDKVRQLILGFSAYPVLGHYLRKKILKRALDPDLMMDLYGTSEVNWSSVQVGLAAIKTPQKRLAALKKILERYPNDEKGRVVLVYTLMEAGNKSEALDQSLRLRQDGLASPGIMAILCDLQAGGGDANEARRSCSEMVEFDFGNPATTERSGDLFLRHGWYKEAYRQYKTLVSSVEENELPYAALRQSLAAAGMGKLDVALRLAKTVATGDGVSGKSDPRIFARYHSAAQIAQMILDAQKRKQPQLVNSLQQRLARTQVMKKNATVKILIWEDLEAPLTLSVSKEGKPVASPNRVDGKIVGLSALETQGLADNSFEIRVEKDKIFGSRDVPYKLYTLQNQGKQASIRLEKGVVTAEKKDS